MNYIVKVQQTRTWAVQVTADNDWDAEQKALDLLAFRHFLLLSVISKMF